MSCFPESLAGKLQIKCQLRSARAACVGRAGLEEEGGPEPEPGLWGALQGGPD